MAIAAHNRSACACRLTSSEGARALGAGSAKGTSATPYLILVAVAITLAAVAGELLKSGLSPAIERIGLGLLSATGGNANHRALPDSNRVPDLPSLREASLPDFPWLRKASLNDYPSGYAVEDSAVVWRDPLDGQTYPTEMDEWGNFFPVGNAPGWTPEAVASSVQLVAERPGDSARRKQAIIEMLGRPPEIIERREGVLNAPTGDRGSPMDREGFRNALHEWLDTDRPGYAFVTFLGEVHPGAGPGRWDEAKHREWGARMADMVLIVEQETGYRSRYIKYDFSQGIETGDAAALTNKVIAEMLQGIQASE